MARFTGVRIKNMRIINVRIVFIRIRLVFRQATVGRLPILVWSIY